MLCQSFGAEYTPRGSIKFENELSSLKITE